MSDNEPLSQSDEVPPLAQVVYDRLNATLLPAASDAADQGESLLCQLGFDLRQWRLTRGLTRQELAEKLYIDVSQLLVLENGMAAPSDITAAQLRVLLSLLTETELDYRLHQSIHQYLPFLGR